MRVQKPIVVLAVLVLVGCTRLEADPPPATRLPDLATSVASADSSAPASTAPASTATPLDTIPVLPHTTIDPSTMTGKLLMGYQGWFTCPGDGSSIDGYGHWIQDGYTTIDVDSFRVDMWPDTTELTGPERCPTQLQYPDGSPAYLYSALNYNSVLRHFQWMSEYGIDGVFLQRFGSQIIYPQVRDQHNLVTEHVRNASDAYGRVWAVMYDVSGTDERNVDLVDTFVDDWTYLVDVLGVTDSPTYLRHDGLPVVAIWGLGFDDRPGTPEEARRLVQFFRDNPDPRYRATVMGGVPFSWRTLEPNARSDPAWADFYCSLDVISPWTVGAYAVDRDVDFWKPAMEDDIARAEDCGAEFMPVVYPGHSFHNPDPTRPFNEIPRRGGRLYWHQVFSAMDVGARLIYNAMFDEVDEGTAMFKVAAKASDAPTGLEVVTMDVDGECLPNDWYLRLAGEASRMLRGEIPTTATIPISPTADCPDQG
jgi:hypothetical protein